MSKLVSPAICLARFYYFKGDFYSTPDKAGGKSTPVCLWLTAGIIDLTVPYGCSMVVCEPCRTLTADCPGPFPELVDLKNARR